MASSKAVRRRKFTLSHDVEVEVRPVPLHLSPNLRYLDHERLGRTAKARIEIGYVDTDCCRTAVVAKIERGMVTAIELARSPGPGGPSGRKKVPKALAGLLEAAMAKAAPGRKAASGLPVPLAKLTAAKALSIETWTCMRICILGWCFTCCWGNDKFGPWSRCMPSLTAAVLE